MADHLQQQILEYVQTTLLAASTVAGAHVYLDRVDELMQSDLPALHIEGGDEDATPDSVDFPTYYTRTYGFTVSCIVGQATGAAKAAQTCHQRPDVKQRRHGHQHPQAILHGGTAPCVCSLCNNCRFDAA